MSTETHEPIVTSAPVGPEPTEADHFLSLAHLLDDSFRLTRRLRKDGWDGPKMAQFCSVLAETGVVVIACRDCGMSAQSAYALRHREPLFARLWEAALTMARERLADELLARSLKGSAEAILRDGFIVGERHTFDNRLAFNILRRLDRRAELGCTVGRPAPADIPLPCPAVSGAWQQLLDAVREDRLEEAEHLLAAPKVDTEVDRARFDADPINFDDDEDVDDGPYVPRRVWQKWDTGEWLTDFPPPKGFTGYQKGEWHESNYHRALSEGEFAALVAAGMAEAPPEPITLEADEAEREQFFSALAAGGDGTAGR